MKKKEPKGIDPWCRYGGEWAEHLVSHPKRRKRQQSTRDFGAGYVDLRLPRAAWAEDLPPPELRIVPAGEPDLPPELLYGSADAVKRKQSQAGRDTARKVHDKFADEQVRLQKEYRDRLTAKERETGKSVFALSPQIISAMAREQDPTGFAKNRRRADKRMRDIINPRQIITAVRDGD